MMKIYKKILLVAAVFSFTVVLCGCTGSYQSDTKDPQLKSPSIISDGVLKVGVDADNPPLAGETSKMAGIDVDVAYAIADNLGLKAEIVDVGSNGAKALNDKKVDIVMGVDKDATFDKCKKSNIYLQTACALFSKDKSAAIPKKGGTYKIASQMASASALAAQNQLDVSNIKLESNLTACFDSLKNDRVNFVAADAVVGTYIANTSDLDVYITALLTKPGGYCVANFETNVILQTKVELALEALKKNGTLSIIERKWLGKELQLDKIPQTEGAANQASMSDVNGGVYDKTS